MHELASIGVTVLTVWLLVYAARRTDAPWWKIWLLARGMVPTAREIREAEERQHAKKAPPHAGQGVGRGKR